MNKLREYLAGSGISQSQFAGAVGVSKGYISQILNGSRIPSLNLAKRIDALSNGEVPMISWGDCSFSQPAASAAQSQEQNHVETPDGC